MLTQNCPKGKAYLVARSPTDVIETSIGKGRPSLVVASPICTITLFLSIMSMNCLALLASQAGLIKTTKSEGESVEWPSFFRIAPRRALQMAFSIIKPPKECPTKMHWDLVFLDFTARMIRNKASVQERWPTRSAAVLRFQNVKYLMIGSFQSRPRQAK